MSDASDYLENAGYNFWFRPAVPAPVRPTSHTISLWSAVTDAEAGQGTELAPLTAPGYARAAATFGEVDEGKGFNDTQVTFPIATADWPQATHYCVHDHLGNPLQVIKQLTTPQAVKKDNQARFEPGDLELTFA